MVWACNAIWQSKERQCYSGQRTKKNCAIAQGVGKSPLGVLHLAQCQHDRSRRWWALRATVVLKGINRLIYEDQLKILSMRAWLSSGNSKIQERKREIVWNIWRVLTLGRERNYLAWTRELSKKGKLRTGKCIPL